MLAGTIVLAIACGEERPDDDLAQMTTLPPLTSATDGDFDDGIGDGGFDDGDEKLDAGNGGTGTASCAEGGDCDECVAYEHTPCDAGTGDPINAMGLNCPGETPVSINMSGPDAARGVRTSFGTTNEWAPREGGAYAVLGSGLVSELDTETPAGDPDVGPTHCNDDVGPNDPGPVLPAPLRVNDVGGDCANNPGLLGTGDCSNTIQGQFGQAIFGAFDYSEIRIVASVPPTNNSLSYDFAFFSTEWPYYYGMPFNDMYVGWLESEAWTGNISFDHAGNPISLNAGFLDFQDAPELHGTCMKQHAGTKWLSTVAPVTPGETITLVLAIFDLQDSILDSYVFLDNFGWGCEGTDTPTTTPVG